MISCNLQLREGSGHSARSCEPRHPAPATPPRLVTEVARRRAMEVQPTRNSLLVVEIGPSEPRLQGLLLGRDLIAVDQPDEADQRDHGGRAPARDRVREQRSCQTQVHGIARQPVGTVHNKVLRALDPHRIDRCAVPKKIARAPGERAYRDPEYGSSHRHRRRRHSPATCHGPLCQPGRRQDHHRREPPELPFNHRLILPPATARWRLYCTNGTRRRSLSRRGSTGPPGPRPGCGRRHT